MVSDSLISSYTSVNRRNGREVNPISKSRFGNLQLNKVNPLFIFKVAIGSAIAIVIAEASDLCTAPRQGLSPCLQCKIPRKNITYRLKRIISFLLAVIISFIMFSSLGMSLGYSVALFLYL